MPKVAKGTVIEAKPVVENRLKRRYDFAVFGEGGQLDKLFCKACGVEIAGNVERPRAAAGVGANQYVMRFMRFPTYCEAKFLLSARAVEVGTEEEKRVLHGYHITHGCKDCLKMDMDLELAQQMYESDLAEQGTSPLKEERVERVVTIDHTGSGML